MKKTTLKNFIYSSVATAAAIGLASCYGEYHTPENYPVPASTSSYSQSRNLKPTVKFPARLAVAKIANSHNDKITMISNQQVERPQYREQISKLHGLAGLVNLNNVAARQRRMSYADLRHSAQRFGANMLGIYTFNTSTHSHNTSSILSVATLGLAPTNTHTSVSALSLTLMDAKTGYIYGVLEDKGSHKSLSSTWGNNSTEQNSEHKSEQQAMDNLMQQLPTFWNGIYHRHSQ